VTTETESGIAKLTLEAVKSPCVRPLVWQRDLFKNILGLPSQEKVIGVVVLVTRERSFRPRRSMNKCGGAIVAPPSETPLLGRRSVLYLPGVAAAFDATDADKNHW